VEPLRLTRDESFARGVVVADLQSCFEGVLADTERPTIPRFASAGCSRLAGDRYIKNEVLGAVSRGFAKLPEGDRAACRESLSAVTRQGGAQIAGTEVWFEKPWVRVEDWQALTGDEQLLFTLAHTEQAVTGMALARIDEESPCRPLVGLAPTFVRAYNLAQSRAFDWPDRLVRRELTDGLEWEVWMIHLHADLWPGEQLKAAGLHHLLGERGTAITESDTVTSRIHSLYPPRD
jgi:hypothetical protein